jgi:uncharacterized protein YbjT (DUF2867 family)
MVAPLRHRQTKGAGTRMPGLTPPRHIPTLPVLFQPIAADDVAGVVAEVALAAPRDGIVEIAGPERAPFNEIIARYLKAVGDLRQVVSDPDARYWGGRVEERSLVPLGEARRGRIGLDEWLRRSQRGA